ncbi:MAG TPA: TIR domain-containing protein [Streptosporangiaceae bacterium]|nr:TIR domain-containing protein [Streptosporangiaceae bacterium]
MASCFISYTQADEPWARWMAAVLREAGHKVTVQATDFRPGENFVIRMQEAASSADHTLVVLSNRYLASGFGAAEWTAAFAADPMGTHRKLIPVAVEKVTAPGLWRAIIRIEIFDKPEEVAKDLLLQAVAQLEPEETRVPFPSSWKSEGLQRDADNAQDKGPQAIEVWRLPASTSTLVGREEELRTLRRCWESREWNLVTVVGWGGSGKTAVVNHWLAEMAAAQYKGADRVFAWSFDTQADGGQVATSDQFIDAALRFFGAEGAHSASVWERCRQVTTLFQQTHSLLILDGLDRLQEPPGPRGGTLREPTLRMLVRELAAFNHGLCVITSRLALADVQQFVGQTCTQISVGGLSRSEGSELLTLAGLHGAQEVLDEVVVEAGYHPLTLSLLGSFIHSVYHGDLHEWRGSALASALEGPGDDTAERVMDEYARWFEGRPESQILTVIGLFDRPASSSEFKAIRSLPIVPGLNDLLTGLSDVQWAYAISNLITSGLLTVGPDEAKTVDAHPLVRSHFGHTLRTRAPEGWREGHRRLCDYLSKTAAARPTRLEDCLPLLSAVWHGTQAGLAAQMLREIYWPRIAQENHLLRDVLGASASNYEVLSYIVATDSSGESPIPRIELGRILCDQAIDLRILGKPQDAVAPLERAAVLASEEEDHRLEVNALRHLAQLYLTIGMLRLADETAVRATEASKELDGMNLDAIAARVTLADIYEHLDNSELAIEIVASLWTVFMDTELTRKHARRATLYIQVYRCIEIVVRKLLAAGEAGVTSPALGSATIDDLSRLVANMSELNKASGNADLPRALMRLAASLISLATGDLGSDTTSAIDLAVSEMRQSGQRPWLIQALLVRVQLLKRLGALDSARSSLGEARSLCLIDGMATNLLDCDFEAALITRAEGNPWQAHIMLESLQGLAANSGYQQLHRQVTLLIAELATGQQPGPVD